MAVFRVERNTGYTVMSNHHLRNASYSDRVIVPSSRAFFILQPGSCMCEQFEKRHSLANS